MPVHHSMEYDPERSRTVYRSGERIYLVRVAQTQRVLLLTLLAQILLLIVWFVAGGLAPRPLRTIAGMVVSLGFLYLSLGAAGSAFNLVRATGLGTLAALLVCVAAFFPFLGILVLSLINQRAIVLIRTHGARVGFLGVPPSEMIRLVEGACPACGYDLRGLPPSVCPECGTPIPDSLPIPP